MAPSRASPLPQEVCVQLASICLRQQHRSTSIAENVDTVEHELLGAHVDVDHRDTVFETVVGAAGQLTCPGGFVARSEEHPSELQSLMRIQYAVLCLKKQ